MQLPLLSTIESTKFYLISTSEKIQLQLGLLTVLMKVYLFKVSIFLEKSDSKNFSSNQQQLGSMGSFSGGTAAEVEVFGQIRV